MSSRNRKQVQIKVKQIVIAQWQGTNGLTYSTIALSKDGKVYRYDAGCQGWYPWSMNIVLCNHRK